MRKVLLYFDPDVQAMFVKHKGDNGEDKLVLSSRHNFAGANQIVARIIDLKNDGEDITPFVDQGYSYYNLRDYFNFETAIGIFFDETIKAYRASHYGFVALRDTKIFLLSP